MAFISLLFLIRWGYYNWGYQQTNDIENCIKQNQSQVTCSKCFVTSFNLVYKKIIIYLYYLPISPKKLCNRSRRLLSTDGYFLIKFISNKDCLQYDWSNVTTSMHIIGVYSWLDSERLRVFLIFSHLFFVASTQKQQVKIWKNFDIKTECCWYIKAYGTIKLVTIPNNNWNNFYVGYLGQEDIRSDYWWFCK